MTVKTKDPVGLNGHARSDEKHGRNGASHIEVLDPLSEDGNYVSEERYWAEYYEHPDFNYEWNNGILEEKPTTTAKQYATYDWFNHLIRNFLEVKPMARKLGLKLGFRLSLPKKVTIRKPDLFVVCHDNPIGIKGEDHTYRGICDQCVESLSDSTQREVERDTIHKKFEYNIVGVREYYILDPSSVHMKFFRRTESGDYAEFDASPEQIIRSQVLPGFQFRIADLIRKPRLVDLIDDEVYQGFVLPEYQAARRRAEQERHRAEQNQQLIEQERQRAEQERQHRERLAARLRALGITDDLE
jgi:Putative restriction endonuclease